VPWSIQRICNSARVVNEAQLNQSYTKDKMDDVVLFTIMNEEPKPLYKKESSKSNEVRMKHLHLVLRSSDVGLK
jgi:hypothetical protein